MFGFHKHHGHRHHAMRGGFGGRFGRGGFEGEWGMEGRGRRGRVFDGGELKLVLLRLIADQPRHGYDLIRAIEELTGGAYAPSPGVVYPTVTMLHDMGLIAESATDSSRKTYAVTGDGTAHLAEHAQEVAALFERLAALASMRERTDRVPVKRAIHNLRNVLQHRLGAEDAGKDMVHDVVAILDEAARRIERL
jgi:DNA-binding PadR family transcriptional regulator